jgi:hypothetical protein
LTENKLNALQEETNHQVKDYLPKPPNDWVA